MALHIGLAALVGGGVGVVSTVSRLAEGESLREALKGGIKDTAETTFNVVTLGLVDNNSGIDVDRDGIHQCYGHDD